MTPHGTAPRTPERPVEARLRRAFEARARTVDVRDLRPAAPPGPHLRRRTVLTRARLRRFALPLAAATATAALVLAYLATTPGTPPPRPTPATPPSPVTSTPPSATPSPSIGPSS
ncbi:hypothetical protein, partial [Streptomyces albospinus]|uniref:hypothetical protein n=1 Tax=Streptomyces albospinus TaxID=285515 RepID=UPI001670CA55